MPNKMQKAAIAIDAWKLSIFDRHLSQSGYAYEHALGITDKTLLLTVCTENLEALAGVVQAANNEAARTGKPK